MAEKMSFNTGDQRLDEILSDLKKITALFRMDGVSVEKKPPDWISMIRVERANIREILFADLQTLSEKFNALSQDQDKAKKDNKLIQHTNAYHKKIVEGIKTHYKPKRTPDGLIKGLDKICDEEKEALSQAVPAEDVSELLKELENIACLVPLDELDAKKVFSKQTVDKKEPVLSPTREFRDIQSQDERKDRKVNFEQMIEMQRLILEAYQILEMTPTTKYFKAWNNNLKIHDPQTPKLGKD